MSSPGTILSADAEKDGGVEHVVGEPDRCGERDGVAREEGQLHADLALGDAVAHCRHAAGNLGRAAGGARGCADDLGEALVRLVRREHVVVGGDDREVGRHIAAERGLVVHGTAGKAMGEVGAGQAPAMRLLARGGVDAVEILRPAAFAAPADALGHGGDARMKGHGDLLVSAIGRRSADLRSTDASGMPGEHRTG